PLADRGGVGRQNQRRLSHPFHHGEADHRLARTAGKNKNTAASGGGAPLMKRLHRPNLIIPEAKRAARPAHPAETDGKRLSFAVPRHILHRISQTQQLPFQLAPPLRRHQKSLPLPSLDRKSTRLNSSHVKISYAAFCLKKKRYQSPTCI